MSFPPFINPADYDRYKAIYLQTLQQQINNNANNYNSVSLYQKTAQPPITPTDTRSIEDKLYLIFICNRRNKKIFRLNLS